MRKKLVGKLTLSKGRRRNILAAIHALGGLREKVWLPLPTHNFKSTVLWRVDCPTARSRSICSELRRQARNTRETSTTMLSRWNGSK
jgi:hypothetical protein